jgi:dolichol-phosphate mannosyltransferase
VFNRLVSWLTHVKLHDHNCGLKCFRREVIHEIRLYGELHRFVPVLAASRGFRVSEIVVGHRPRQFGKSKYGLSRIIKALLDLLTVKFVIGYGQRPQHLLGTIGLVSFGIGAAGMIYLAIRWCLSRMIEGWQIIHLHETAALFYSLALILIGAQFMSFGFLGEMITAYLVREADTYSIAEHTSPRRAAEPARTGKASDKP